MLPIDIHRLSAIKSIEQALSVCLYSPHEQKKETKIRKEKKKRRRREKKEYIADEINILLNLEWRHTILQ